MEEKHNTDQPAAIPPSALQEREKCDKSLSEYTHMVSHDLNAPLRHIVQYGELLKKEVGDRLGANGTMYVDKLILNTKRLQQLINNLLAYAQVIRISEEKKELDLNKTVSEAVMVLKPLIEENHATIDVRPLPTLPAYPFRITQVFRHLIANAVIYRGKAPPVVTIACEDENTHYRFYVQDNGRGIPEKHLKTVFAPLSRLQSQDEIEGAGLGLAICEKAVEAHGGKIWAESSPGEGARFIFTLPKSP